MLKNKEQLRKEMLERRKGMEIAEVSEKSKIIINKIENMNSYKKARTVLFYYPVKNEVDIIPLIKNALETKTICLPKVEKQQRTMTARQIKSLDELTEGKYGIMLPNEEAKLINCSDVDFVIIPLAVFDKSNHRIGYGGGYYDTYLKKCCDSYKCGVAFAFQKVDRIECEDHDIKLNIVITD